MSLSFGFSHYVDVNICDRPETVVDALRYLAPREDHESLTFRCMYRESDKWTRAVKPSDNNVRKLSAGLRGGRYSDVVISARRERVPFATLSITCAAESRDGRYPFSVQYVAEPESQDVVSTGVRIAFGLWRIFRPGYGFSIVATSSNDTMSELTGIPIIVSGQEPSASEQARLLRIQTLRPRFGECVRPLAWGQYLGRHLVHQLGGVEAIRAGAPVAKVDTLPNGGVYLQLTQDPRPLGNPEFQVRAQRLATFLAPVIAAELLMG